jgi:hypothetical protein
MRYYPVKLYRDGSKVRMDFAVFPQEGCFTEDFKVNLSTQLGVVKARTHKEALRLAKNKNIGDGIPIWVIQLA